MGNKCCSTLLTEEEAKKILTHNGLNKTKGKVSILMIIAKSEKPLSISEIHSLMQESCDVSTIFRTITQFKEKHLVTEVNLEEGFFRYEINLKNKDHHHHHHIRCRICGDIKNIEKCDLALFEKAIMKMGFKQMEHRLEFTGICNNCYKN